MGYKIDEIEGIGPAFREKLTGADITSTDDLLKHCASAKGRKDTEAKTGVSASQLLKWTNMADLMRVSGVGRQYAELLEAAGVDTIKELRTRNVENLAKKMGEVNDEKHLSKSSPSDSMVKDWIEQAKTTEPMISH
jgi:predicted flap endonuclease-1-like 5' DNA nuclease